MEKYEGYLLFECTFHKIFIYPYDDQGTAMTLLPFYITYEDVQKGMVEWPYHLQPLLDEETDTIKMCFKHNQDQRKYEFSQ
jgi:hypothetical protein